MNKAEQRHVDKVAATGCCVCRKFHGLKIASEVHHIAIGSGKRSHFATVSLCPEHHRNGPDSFHGGGSRKFLMRYKLPSEYHLLIIQNEFMAIDNL
jgi:hypothetical protein